MEPGMQEVTNSGQEIKLTGKMLGYAMLKSHWKKNNNSINRLNTLELEGFNVSNPWFQPSVVAVLCAG